MTLPNLTNARSVSMSRHPAISEDWLEDRIHEDPSLLGLGDLDVIDRQKSQPTGGRLDLLLRDPDTLTRYVVELQLGSTDPSHIVRAIEYWDVERLRYPDHDHVAVIVAEDVTGRFFNVINLFNGLIPLIAIQMKCVEVEGNHALIATRVLDRVQRGIEEEEGAELADHSSWKARFPETLPIVDKLFGMIKAARPEIEPNYRKSHITLSIQGKVNAAIGFRPRKYGVRAWFKALRTQELTDNLESAGINMLSKNDAVYEFMVYQKNVEHDSCLLKEVIDSALKGL